MRIAPLILAASAALVGIVSLSGCTPAASNVTIDNGLASARIEYGIVIDDASGKIVKSVENSFSDSTDLEHYTARPGETLFVFEGWNSIKSSPFPLEGQITIDGTSYRKDALVSYSLTGAEIIAYYNRIVDQGFTHDFKDYETSPADLVVYDIDDRLEMADIDDTLPIVPLTLDGSSESKAYAPIADYYNSGLTGDEAAVKQQEANCKELTDHMGYGDNNVPLFNPCEQPLPATSSEPNTIASTITEYDFNCATVGLTVSNWTDTVVGLNAAIDTTNLRFSVENVGKLDITASQPCALKTYTHTEVIENNDGQTAVPTEGSGEFTGDNG